MLVLLPMGAFRMPIFLSPDDGNGGAGGGAGGEPKTVPVEALQAERKARQELEKRLADIDAANKAREEKAAADAGEHRKLYESLKPEHEKATARLAELEGRETKRLEKVDARNKERLKALPEAAQKALKPIAATMSPDDFADWLEENGGTFGATSEGVSAGTRRATGQKAEEPIPPEATAHWKKFGERLGVSERDWFEKTWKPLQKKAS
jgi:hypothetical protein